ncbi:MAG: peptidoglycan-binding protein [Gammaproteobacteria bacterium]|nr:peptidoglycan-binding protein [Gammaproteobacteria bacterium]
MIKRRRFLKTYIAAILIIFLSACAELPVETGDASSKTVVTGSAGGANAQNANKELEHCDRPLGTMALVEEQHTWWYTMRGYGVQSTVPILRLMAQQSNCFVVVERGLAFRNITQERSLEQSGELRSNSNFDKGQLVSADYTLTPTLTFSDRNTGGVGGIIGGAFGSLGAIVGGGLKFSQASTLLALVDNRSGVQVLAAEGSAKGTSLGGLFGLGRSKFAGALGSYAQTPEAKVIVAAMMDAFNNVIIASRSYVAQETGGKGLGTGGALEVSGSTIQPRYDQSVLTVLKVQQQLIALKYDPGVADGIMGEKTRKALKAFQADYGLPVTGEIDSAGIDKLNGFQ